jgi:putative salt-induced outer membrane protein YdiY
MYAARMRRAFLPVLVLCTLLGRRASAQIVDVQALIGPDVPQGASGKLDASVDWRTGNTRSVHVGGAVVARWRTGDHLLFAIARGEYGESAGVGSAPLVTDAAKDFEHVRYRWHARPWLSTEVFAQHEADRFRRLRLRALTGAGLRVRIASCATWAIHVGAAYMAEYEQLVDDAQLDAGQTTADSRLSTYAVGTWKFNEDVSASETVYVQPRFTDPRDLRLLDETALTAKIAKHVAFRFALVLAHDSRPPPATAHSDTTLQSGLQLSI